MMETSASVPCGEVGLSIRYLRLVSFVGTQSVAQHGIRDYTEVIALVWREAFPRRVRQTRFFQFIRALQGLKGMSVVREELVQRPDVGLGARCRRGDEHFRVHDLAS